MEKSELRKFCHVSVGFSLNERLHARNMYDKIVAQLNQKCKLTSACHGIIAEELHWLENQAAAEQAMYLNYLASNPVSDNLVHG